MKRIIFSSFIVFLFIGCSREKTVTGEIFIVTQGGQNYKLGLVNVGLIQYEKLKAHIVNKSFEATNNIKPVFNEYRQLKDSISLLTNIADEYDKQINHWSDESLNGLNKKLDILYKARSVAYDKLRLLNKIAPIENIYLKYTNGIFFLSDLPKLDDSTKTDSDGRFNFIVRKDVKYYFVATASRSLGENKEYYYWIVEYPNPSFREDQKVLLSNDNLFDPLTILNLDNKGIHNATETTKKSAT